MTDFQGLCKPWFQTLTFSKLLTPPMTAASIIPPSFILRGLILRLGSTLYRPIRERSCLLVDSMVSKAFCTGLNSSWKYANMKEKRNTRGSALPIGDTVLCISNRTHFPCLQSFIKTRGGLGEFETVMKTWEVVEGLHNFENSPNPPSVKMRLCKHGESALLLLQNNS